MVVWKGWGISALIIPLLCSWLAEMVFNSINGVGSYKDSSWGMPLVLSLSSVLVYFIGCKLNNKPGRILIDPENNEKIELKDTHTMFWIPLQYWGVIVFGIGIWMYVANIGLIYQK